VKRFSEYCFVCISIFVEGIRSQFFSAAMILPLPAMFGTGAGMVL